MNTERTRVRMYWWSEGGCECVLFVDLFRVHHGRKRAAAQIVSCAQTVPVQSAKLQNNANLGEHRFLAVTMMPRNGVTDHAGMR